MPVLRLLETLRFGPDHAGGINGKIHGSVRMMFQAFFHIKHGFMNRMFRRQTMPEFQDFDSFSGIVP